MGLSKRGVVAVGDSRQRVQAGSSASGKNYALLLLSRCSDPPAPIEFPGSLNYGFAKVQSQAAFPDYAHRICVHDGRGY
jgi:hypothetical protein